MEMDSVGLSIPAAGASLGGKDKPLSRATIYRMIARNDLEAFKVGTRTLVTVESIKAFAAKAPRLATAA